jgi:ubiquinone biosynthesis protein
MNLARARTLPAGPQRLRRWFESRGPTFIKIGQFLSLRPDILPQEYCDELLELVDRAPEFSWEQAKAMLAADLGEDPEKRFAWIDSRPIAAASMSQVHLAFTHEGKEVAVKIQRPRIREQIERELRGGRLLTAAMRSVGTRLAVPGEELLAELRRWLEQELDFQRELGSIARLYRLHRESTHIRIPRPYPELSGTHVLTMEYLRGISFSEILRWIRSGEDARLAEHQVDRTRLAEILVEAVLDQIFRKELFQADPHPGNLIALPGSAVGFIDFGLMEELSGNFKRVLAHNLIALYSGDAERMSSALMELLVAGKRANPEGFRNDFLAAAKSFSRQRGEPVLVGGRERSPLAQYLIDTVQIARKHGFQLPPDVLAVYRSLLTVETIAQELGGKANLHSVGRRFFRQLQVEQSLEDLEPEQLRAMGLDLLTLFREGPGQIQRLLADLSSDRFLLRVRTTEHPEDRQEANRRARLITAAVVSVGLATLLAGVDRIPLLRESGATVPILTGLLVAVYVWIFVLWRRLS